MKTLLRSPRTNSHFTTPATDDRPVSCDRFSPVRLTGNELPFVSLEAASASTRRYRRSAQHATVKGVFFSSDIFHKILGHPEIVALSIVPGMTEHGGVTLVLGGLTGDMHEVPSLFGQHAIPCPPFCSSLNPLNSGLGNGRRLAVTPRPTFPTAVSHAITHAEAQRYRQAFHSSAVRHHLEPAAVSMVAVRRLLDQTVATGIRIYFGVSLEGRPEYILAAVDASAEDIFRGSLARSSTLEGC